MFHLDKEKYIRLAQTQGVSTALTTLHRDKERWEFETFEGQEGYQPEMWKVLQDINAFSRELWDMELENGQPSGS